LRLARQDCLADQDKASSRPAGTWVWQSGWASRPEVADEAMPGPAARRSTGGLINDAVYWWRPTAESE
jgi:hypothetical protein